MSEAREAEQLLKEVEEEKDAKVALKEQQKEFGEEPFFKPDIKKCEFSTGFYDEDLDNKIEAAMMMADKEVSVRTGHLMDGEETGDREKDGTYVPRVVGPDDPPLDPKSDKEKDMEEVFPSELGWKRWGILKATLMMPTSRIFIQRLNGATKKDLAHYTHKFDLLKDDPWELFNLLAGFKQGDVWMCCIAGDILYHLPERRYNLFLDPLVREKIVELDSETRFRAIKKALAEQKPNGVRGHEVRITGLEKDMAAIASDIESFMKAFKQQQQAVQIMLKLGEKEKYNHDLILHLNDNVGRHEQELRRLTKAADEKGFFSIDTQQKK